MRWLVTAALSGATAVALGAFGAHGLKSRVPPESVESWNTAVEYHLLHSVVLLALALYTARGAGDARWAMRLLAGGIALFSGSIYVLVLGGPRVLGPITPIGGAFLISGWIAVIALARQKRD
ncbi:MAG: hypothetical protein CL910_01830 [Deltaproteobacteria bacterium]|nr:hypothetical protein [Deltaproteobacteria bacterium]